MPGKLPVNLPEQVEMVDLVVADAFRGRLAVLHPVSLEPIVERNFPGTNIRGVTFTPDDAHCGFCRFAGICRRDEAGG